MSTTPNGYPAWVRSADHTTYGGHADKTNYQSQGVVNPQTDIGAEAFTRLVADLEAIQRTAPWCVLTVTCNDASPAAPTITVINQMTGVRTASYSGDAAPSGYPSAARNGNGDVTITWATSYADPYGVTGTVHVAHATASAHGSSSASVAVALTDTNADGFNEAVRVRCWSAGAALADATFTLAAYTGMV